MGAIDEVFERETKVAVPSARGDDAPGLSDVVLPPGFHDVLLKARALGGTVEGTELARVLKEGRPGMGSFTGTVLAVEPELAGGVVLQRFAGQAIKVHRLQDFEAPEELVPGKLMQIRYRQGRASGEVKEIEKPKDKGMER